MYRYIKSVFLIFLLLIGGQAMAWLDRPVRMIVPLPPGGGGDTVARLLAAELSAQLGQPFVVENRPGGGSVIGTQAVARAPADGYTVLMATDFHAINGAVGGTPYDAVTDFEPVAQLIELQIILLSRPGKGWKSLQDMLAEAKAQPGKVVAASPGTSSPHYLAFKLLEQDAGVTFLDVPYQGTGPVTVAFLGDQVDLMFSGVGAAKGLIDAGKAVPLGVTSLKRDAVLPQVPTIAESGYPDYSIVSWMALLAPAGTPQQIVEQLNAATRRVLAKPSVQATLSDAGFTVQTGTPQDLRHLIETDISKLRGILEKAAVSNAAAR